MLSSRFVLSQDFHALYLDTWAFRRAILCTSVKNSTGHCNLGNSPSNMIAPPGVSLLLCKTSGWCDLRQRRRCYLCWNRSCWSAAAEVIADGLVITHNKKQPSLNVSKVTGILEFFAEAFWHSGAKCRNETEKTWEDGRWDCWIMLGMLWKEADTDTQFYSRLGHTELGH